jgi:hypothetical protein
MKARVATGRIQGGREERARVESRLSKSFKTFTSLRPALVGVFVSGTEALAEQGRAMKRVKHLLVALLLSATLSTAL